MTRLRRLPRRCVTSSTPSSPSSPIQRRDLLPRHRSAELRRIQPQPVRLQPQRRGEHRPEPDVDAGRPAGQPGRVGDGGRQRSGRRSSRTSTACSPSTARSSRPTRVPRARSARSGTGEASRVGVRASRSGSPSSRRIWSSTNFRDLGVPEGHAEAPSRRRAPATRRWRRTSTRREAPATCRCRTARAPSSAPWSAPRGTARA